MEPHSCRRGGTFPLPQALVLLLFLSPVVLCDPETSTANASLPQADTDAPFMLLWRGIKGILTLLLAPTQRLLHFFLDWILSLWTVKGMLTLCGFGAVWFWKSNNEEAPDRTREDAAATDPGLLKKHSTTRSYTISRLGLTYPEIRTFYRPHPQESKLPTKPRPIPLLVFIHGLGGSIAQFHPILTSLVNIAPCLAIDLPGCGLSAFRPKRWDAYKTDALVHLLAEAIEAHRDREGKQGVVLIGHSMGCSLAALLASSSSPYRDLISRHVVGYVAICPKAEPPSLELSKSIRTLTSIPGPLFDLYRKYDRRGGINSQSVIRMTGPGADEATRKLQMRFNKQSRTPVWQRMLRGMAPDYSSGQRQGGLPGEEVWRGLDLPVFLAAGEADTVTTPENIQMIVRFLGKDEAGTKGSPKETLNTGNFPDLVLPERKHQDSGVDAADLPKPTDDHAYTDSSGDDSGPETESRWVKDEKKLEYSRVQSKQPEQTPSEKPLPGPLPRHLVVKSHILPAPASHSLPFATSSSRTLAGLIGDFLAAHIDPRLSLGWQLQYLCTEGKWDVKNLAKWKDVQPVSRPIGNIFRAMKTLREVDEEHCPKVFVKEWKDRIRVVVDISHESPVYDPKGLEEGGIAYRKFPTVSKLPPSTEEVAAFIALIDNIRHEFNLDTRPDSLVIGIHCHYGFNRTGFFVVSYLVERLKYRVEDAIEEFAQMRSPGIRHQHFVDALHVRYCVGLKKAPTL